MQSIYILQSPCTPCQPWTADETIRTFHFRFTTFHFRWNLFYASIKRFICCFFERFALNRFLFVSLKRFWNGFIFLIFETLLKCIGCVSFKSFLRFNEMLLKQVCRNGWNVQKQRKIFLYTKTVYLIMHSCRIWQQISFLIIAFRSFHRLVAIGCQMVGGHR